MRRFLTGVLLLCAACSKKPTGAGLDVDVLVDEAVKADCVTLTVRGSSGELSSKRLARHPKLQVGVVSTPELTGEVRLVARGYLGDCAGQPTLNAQSSEVTATFLEGQVRPVTVKLEGALDDLDLDGFR